jgi:hypothetical protein
MENELADCIEALSELLVKQIITTDSNNFRKDIHLPLPGKTFPGVKLFLPIDFG